MVPMYLFAKLLQQCQSSLLQSGEQTLPFMSLYSSKIFQENHKQEIFAPSFSHVWNQMLWRNLLSQVLLQDFYLMIQCIVRI